MGNSFSDLEDLLIPFLDNFLFAAHPGAITERNDAMR
jgi:hypothetical protein